MVGRLGERWVRWRADKEADEADEYIIYLGVGPVILYSIPTADIRN